MQRNRIEILVMILSLVFLVGAVADPALAGSKGKPQPEPGDPAICCVATSAQLGTLTVMDADGTHQTAVMSGAIRTAWSHDDTKLVASGVVKKLAGIFTMNVDGSDRTCIFPLSGTPYRSDVDWSPVPAPDGEYKILFTRDIGNGGSHDLVVVNSDGSDEVWLTNTQDNWATGRWSPQGDRILAFKYDPVASWTAMVVLEIGVDAYGDLEVVSETDITTGGILENGSGYYGSSWLNNQDAVVISFSSGFNSGFDLYLIDLADPLNPVQLTFTPDVDECFPAVDPIDQKIAFERSTPDGRFFIYCMNMDGTGLVNLSNLKRGSHRCPRWRRSP
jgi:Tol biopolymer transport system component